MRLYFAINFTSELSGEVHWFDLLPTLPLPKVFFGAALKNYYEYSYSATSHIDFKLVL